MPLSSVPSNLFGGAFPIQIVLKDADTVFALTSGLTLWKSIDRGVTFEVVNVDEDHFYGYIAFDSSGRLWKRASGGSSSIQIYRSDNGEGTDFVLKASFDGYDYGSSLRGIACHPDNPDVIAVSYTSGFAGGDAIAAVTTNGEDFAEVSLVSTLFIRGAPEVVFTSAGTLLIEVSYYSEATDEYDRCSIFRSTDYSSFVEVTVFQTNGTDKKWNTGYSPAFLVHESEVYFAIDVSEITHSQHPIFDYPPWGSDAGEDNFLGYRGSPSIRVYYSSNEGLSWTEIPVPGIWRVPESIFDSYDGYQADTYVPGYIAGLYWDDALHVVFDNSLSTEEPNQEGSYRADFIWNKPWSGTRQEWSFSVNGHSYTWYADFVGESFVTGWLGEVPSSFTDVQVTFVGNSGGDGYGEWINFDSSYPMVLDAGNSDYGDNADETIFNGAALGQYHAYSIPGYPFVVIDHVLNLADLPSPPDQTVGYRFPGYRIPARQLGGLPRLGFIWRYDGTWTDVGAELESAAGYTEARVYRGMVSQ